jgi:LuxR family maltose regulon positive regulatory protein
VKEQPYLCVLHAWALLYSGQFEATRSRLLDAENAISSVKHLDTEDIDIIFGLIYSHQAYMALFFGDYAKSMSYARRALDHLPETAILIRVQTALYMGNSCRHLGQLQEASDIFNETLTLTHAMEGNLTPVMCYVNLGEISLEMAQLHRAKEIYEQALKFTERQTGRPDMPFSGLAYVRIGTILRQWNQLEDARRFTAKGVALCQDLNEPNIMALSRIELAYISQASGNDEQAHASIQEAILLYESISPWANKLAAAHQAKMDLERGDIDAGERWAQANDLVTDGDFEFHREIEYLVLARVLIAQKRFEEAHSLVERIYRIAQEIGKRQTELEGLILLALVISVQGETDQALVYLEKALSIGEPEGFIRVFVDEGPPLARLLYEALTRGLAPDYVRRLLAAFPAEERKRTEPPKSQASESELIEPLSERERDVLQLIAEGLTNREIGERLFLSLNTVKAHTRNIYGKLDTHNRTQAVARARALGVLPPT